MCFTIIVFIYCVQCRAWLHMLYYEYILLQASLPTTDYRIILVNDY